MYIHTCQQGVHTLRTSGMPVLAGLLYWDIGLFCRTVRALFHVFLVSFNACADLRYGAAVSGHILPGDMLLGIDHISVQVRLRVCLRVCM